MPQNLELHLQRHASLADRTLGQLTKNGVHVCFTCEDVVRPAGVKVADATAIPAGRYLVTVAYSPTFKKDLPRLANVPGFAGILMHGGNGPEDTRGCILVGRQQDKTKIWDCAPAVQALIDMIELYTEARGQVWLTISPAPAVASPAARAAQLTPQGLAAIVREEGFKPSWYFDEAGIKTIGIGHVVLPAEEGKYLAPGFKLTQLQGMELLQQDIAERFAPPVVKLCTRACTPNQLAALVSFCFNVGPSGLAGSTLLRLHNAGTAPAAQITAAFGMWNKITKAGQKVVSPGLTARRAREAALYLTP
jgi:lysozyme